MVKKEYDWASAILDDHSKVTIIFCIIRFSLFDTMNPVRFTMIVSELKLVMECKRHRQRFRDLETRSE